MAKTAVITGASSGIGRALAKTLAREGYAIGLLARRRDRLDALASELRAEGHEAAFEICDVQDREGSHVAIRRLEAELGPTDLLVLNAGMSSNTPPFEPDGEGFEQEVRTNLLGAFYPLEVVIPGMVERGRGHVVAVSSVAGWIALPGEGGYCATKAALTRLFESLRVDWATKGIHTTIVHPGFVDTEIVAGAEHPMPFFLPVDKAADVITRAIRRKKKRCDFPRRMVWLVRAGRLMPDGLKRWVNRRSRQDG